MIEIGGRPILWHIMKIYAAHGVNEFIICCGYKGYLIKEYFRNYFIHMSDITIDLATNDLTVHNRKGEDWKVTLVDTGENSMTGGRSGRCSTLWLSRTREVRAATYVRRVQVSRKPGWYGWSWNVTRSRPARSATTASSTAR